jgi:hypothetical protein
MVRKENKGTVSLGIIKHRISIGVMIQSPVSHTGLPPLPDGIVEQLHIVAEATTVSPTSAQIRRNWFLLSQLVTILAIGLWKPYAKSESGMNLVAYDVY